MLLLSQINEMTWAKALIELATAGGFGVLVWYLIVKYIPRMEDRHKEEREAIQARADMQVDKLAAELKEIAKALRDRHDDA